MQEETVERTMEHAYPRGVCVQIQKGDEQGIDLRPYATKGYTASVLKQIRCARKEKVNVDFYASEGYDGEQLREIRVAMTRGVSLVSYLIDGYCGAQLRQIRKGMLEHLDVTVYADVCYNWLQMREIRFGLKNRLDVTVYANPLFSWQQMREIRTGMEEGIDVTSYARVLYSCSDMREMRYTLTQKLYGENVEMQEITINDEGSDMNIRLAKNRMEAYMVFPQDDKRVNLTVDYIEQILKRNGIVYGIDREGIAEALKEKRFDEEILVAKGSNPADGEDGRYEFFFNTEPSRKPVELEDGRVDYQNVDIFEEVMAGQVLAKYIPPKKGEDGHNVRNVKISGVKGKEQQVLQGSGFHLEPDGVTYIADMPGIIEYRNGTMHIYETLTIRENVSSSYGNIHFKGCIHIFGNVGMNVEIQSQGSIIVEGTVEAANITSKGDVLIKNGMVGAGKGSIRAGGNIAGNFFESCRLYAGANIEAGYLMNSESEAEKKAVMQGRRGAIIGGKTRAVFGITANSIGNYSQIATEVETGASRAIMERIHKAQEEYESLEAQLNALEKKIESASQEEKQQMTYRIIQAEHLKLKEEAELAAKKWHKEEEILRAGSSVTVRSKAYTGTTVIINQHMRKLEGDYKMVTFLLVDSEIITK